MLALGAFLQVAAHALRAWNPPFGLFVVTFWLVSIGQAFQDTHGNTFVAGLKIGTAHRWLAFIHAMYMGGCLIGPFVSTAVASAGGQGSKPLWYLFYTFPLGLGVANLALVAVAFGDTLRLHSKKPLQDLSTNTSPNEAEASQQVPADSQDESRNRGAIQLIKDTLSTPSVWLLCMFFFFYLGSVLTASGWVVEYLVDVRNGDLSQMGYVPAGFNGGCLLGRLLLAEPTHRFGERKMVFIYCLLAIALQLIFWLYVTNNLDVRYP
jgi:fucose permease